jgi:threonine synthase
MGSKNSDLMLKSYCSKCGKVRTEFTGVPTCSCGGIMIPKIDFKYREGDFRSNYPYLSRILSLGEVETPMVDFGQLKMKLEYFSPTFSYKDRGSRVLISALTSSLPEGSEINEDSSGNAGASISAYGRAAGYKVNIFVPEKTREGKIEQIKAYGAAVHSVRGSREDVSRAAMSHKGYYASHVLNPEFRDGMRQISYEIFRQLGHKSPRRIFLPVSAGTLLLGMISGFEHLLASGEISKIPEFVAVQTEAVSPLCAAVNGFIYDPSNIPDSVADALVSRNPPLLDLMVEKVREYGRCITVSEYEIVESRKILAENGYYVEYSSATVHAAATKISLVEDSLLVLTGNGLKTP